MRIHGIKKLSDRKASRRLKKIANSDSQFMLFAKYHQGIRMKNNG
jgi:hypothetical protein